MVTTVIKNIEKSINSEYDFIIKWSFSSFDEIKKEIPKDIYNIAVQKLCNRNNHDLDILVLC